MGSLFGLWASGCLPAWRPSLDQVAPAPGDVVVHLAGYLPGEGEATRLYFRRNLTRPDETPQRYLRRHSERGVGEGVLARGDVDTVAEYLQPTPRARERRGTLWPLDQQRTAAAFFLEFSPPLPHLPEVISCEQPWSQSSELHCYNRDAEPAGSGIVEREVSFQGFEDVRVGATVYADCVRLRRETRFRVRWGPRVDRTEYLWLAPALGEVKRIERVAGFAGLMYFSVAHRYELARLPAESPSPSPGIPPVGPGPPRPQAWARCAVFLERMLPRPSLGGLLVDSAPLAEVGALAVAGSTPRE